MRSLARWSAAAMAVGALLPATVASGQDGETAQAPVDAAAEAPVADEPVADEPVDDEPVDDEPVAEEPVDDGEEAAEATDGVAESDPGRGEYVSVVAACAPRGNRLHGTGLNHGGIVSAVARGDAVVVPRIVGTDVDTSETTVVDSRASAASYCDRLVAFVAAREDVAPAARRRGPPSAPGPSAGRRDERDAGDEVGEPPVARPDRGRGNGKGAVEVDGMGKGKGRR